MNAASQHTVRDPRVLRSRAIILDAASRHFLEHGYLDANVDAIAAQAGVSKRTIYNIFGGKESLFREILADALRTAERFSEDAVGGLADRDDVAEALRDTALRLVRSVFGGRVVPLRRLLIGEAVRFPDLAADYYQRAPGRVLAAIAAALRGFDRRGLLRVPDPSLAAEHYAFLVLGAALDRALFETREVPSSSAETEARALAGVDVFLRAYADR